MSNSKIAREAIIDGYSQIIYIYSVYERSCCHDSIKQKTLDGPAVFGTYHGCGCCAGTVMVTESELREYIENMKNKVAIAKDLLREVKAGNLKVADEPDEEMEE